jgi:dTDP-4-dehydrorhamnose 3,5-epimerase
MPFRFEALATSGAMIVEPTVLTDDRGSFVEVYKRSLFAEAGIYESFAQENVSISRRGVLRGLHYQRAPHAQNKLVRVARGEIYDVIVDLRHDAGAEKRWTSVRLSEATRRMLYVPGWCAHGFCVTSDEAEVVYLTSSEYAPLHEHGVMWNDPALQIEWPVSSPIVSARDLVWPPFQALRRSARTGNGK